MSAILHRRLHGHSSHLSSTSQHHQLRIHRLIKETMASIHDQLQCCLLVPKTNENQKTKHQQHTRDPRRRQTKHCRSQHKNKGRLFQLIRILQWRISVSDKRNCRQFKILRQNSTFVMSLILNVITLLHHANSASDKLYTRCAELRTRSIPSASRFRHAGY